MAKLQSRHFVPGYYRPVPPGRGRQTAIKLAPMGWIALPVSEQRIRQLEQRGEIVKSQRLISLMRTNIDELSYAEKLAVLTKLYLELRLALPDAHRAAEADVVGRGSVRAVARDATEGHRAARFSHGSDGASPYQPALRVGTPLPLALAFSLTLTLSRISATIDICGPQPRTADLVTNLFCSR